MKILKKIMKKQSDDQHAGSKKSDSSFTLKENSDLFLELDHEFNIFSQSLGAKDLAALIKQKFPPMIDLLERARDNTQPQIGIIEIDRRYHIAIFRDENRLRLIALEDKFTLNYNDALIKSRELLQNLLALSADFSFEIDQNGLFTYIFPRFVFGVDTADWLGREADSVLWPRGNRPARSPVWATQKQYVKALPINFNQVEKCFDILVDPFKDDRTGKHGGIRGAAHDVTERYQKAQIQRRDQLSKEAQKTLIDISLDAKSSDELLERISASLLNIFRADGVAVVAFAGRDIITLALQGDILTNMPDAARLRKSDQPVHYINHEGRRLAFLNLAAGSQQGILRSEGVALLSRDTKLSPWSGEEIHLMTILASTVSAAYEKAQLIDQLTKMANTDSLTGLLNRRAFEHQLKRRLAKNKQGVFAFVDLDSFKQVNDTLGHKAGDDALKYVADFLKNHIRPVDILCRFGGDEFVIWLEDVNIENASKRSALLIREMPAIREKLGNKELELSASIGLCSVMTGESPRLEDLASSADSALYRVKQKGKSAIAIAEKLTQNNNQLNIQETNT